MAAGWSAKLVIKMLTTLDIHSYAVIQCQLKPLNVALMPCASEHIYKCTAPL